MLGRHEINNGAILKPVRHKRKNRAFKIPKEFHKLPDTLYERLPKGTRHKLIGLKKEMQNVSLHRPSKN